MKIINYNAKRHVGEIEWQGKIREISAEAALILRMDLNEELPEASIPDLLKLSEEILCRQYLYSYIGKYFKTRKGYYDKLHEKGYSREAAEKALDKAQENGYIDDRNFAERYVEANSYKKGYYKLKTELRNKGVGADIVDEVLETVGPQTEELLTLARKLCKKPLNSPEEKAKLSRKLASRGFSYDEINSVISKLTD